MKYPVTNCATSILGRGNNGCFRLDERSRHGAKSLLMVLFCLSWER